MIPIICFMLFSCTQHSANYNEFKKMATDEMQGSIKNDKDSQDKFDKLCDCFARKASIKYKTVQAGKADMQGMKDLFFLCQNQLSK